MDLGTFTPAVEEDSFHGIDPTLVKLKVADDALETWKAHPVWSLFNVYSDKTVDVDEIAAAEHIILKVSGNSLLAEAPAPIDLIEIYDAAGAKVASATPAATSASMTLQTLPQGILVVRVKAADLSKSIKIMR